MKIVVLGLGYVGLSNAVLLAQHNEVIGVDLSSERVDLINNRKSPITDSEIDKYLSERNLNIRATTEFSSFILDADYVIISTPTNYDENTSYFDTSSVEKSIEDVLKSGSKACIVIKSTIPVGFVKEVRARFNTNKIIFSPEFLREGRALLDNLYPDRIIVGEKSKCSSFLISCLHRSFQSISLSRNSLLVERLAKAKGKE